MKKLSTLNSKFSINKGSTLIELLLYIGLLAIFLGVLTGLFGTAVEIFISSQSTSGIAIDSTYLLSKLKYDIQRAESISTPGTSGTTSSTLSLVIDGGVYTYSLDGSGNLIYSNPSGTFLLNSYLARISSLSFTKLGNVGGIEETVKINMTLNSRVIQAKGEEVSNISTAVALHRN